MNRPGNAELSHCSGFGMDASGKAKPERRNAGRTGQAGRPYWQFPGLEPPRRSPGPAPARRTRRPPTTQPGSEAAAKRQVEHPDADESDHQMSANARSSWDQLANHHLTAFQGADRQLLVSTLLALPDQADRSLLDRDHHDDHHHQPRDQEVRLLRSGLYQVRTRGSIPPAWDTSIPGYRPIPQRPVDCSWRSARSRMPDPAERMSARCRQSAPQPAPFPQGQGCGQTRTGRSRRSVPCFGQTVDLSGRDHRPTQNVEELRRQVGL